MAARQNPASRDPFHGLHFLTGIISGRLLNGATLSRHATVKICHNSTSDELFGNPRNRLIDANK